jgi:hypothetical protein
MSSVYTLLTLLSLSHACLVLRSTRCRNTFYEPLLSSSIKEPMAGRSRMGVGEMSLMFHPSVPNSVRILIPVILIGTMTMFLSSNVSIGASVDLLLKN